MSERGENGQRASPCLSDFTVFFPSMPRQSNNPIPLLAFKLTDHDAWSPCQVSLPSTGPQTILNVQFPGLEGNNEVNIFTANEARARLRSWSKLSGKGQCLQMHEGDTVLASRKLDKGLPIFFDARIEKIDRQRHSARASCKCSFELLWLDREMKGNVCTVPASQICQIIEGNLQEHPIIAEWLKYVISECGNQPEQTHVRIPAQAYLEEESVTIRTMADQYQSEEEMTAEAAGVQQSHQRRQRLRGKGKLESIPEAVSVRTSTRKRSRSSKTEVLEDKAKPEPSLPFGKGPHLSPLAFESSGCPSSGTPPILHAKMLEPQPQKNAGSARTRQRSLVARYDQDEIETSLNGPHKEEQQQGKTGSRRRPGTTKGRSRRSPKSKALSTIQEASVESKGGFPSENQNQNSIVALPNDILDDNPLRESTNRVLKEDKPKGIAKRDATRQLKKARGQGDVSAVRSSETGNSTPRKEMHSPADATKHEALEGKAEVLETASGVKRGRKSSRSKLNSESTTIVEEQDSTRKSKLLRFQTRRIPFDALPVGFGLGITGCPPSPQEPLQSQPSPQDHPDLLDFQIEQSDVGDAMVLRQPSPEFRGAFQIEASSVNHAVEHNGHQSSTAVEKKAIIEDRSAGWEEAENQRLPAADRITKEEENLSLNQGKKVMVASARARAKMKAFNCLADIEKLSGGEAEPISKEHSVSSPNGYYEQDANPEASTKVANPEASTKVKRTRSGKRTEAVSLQNKGEVFEMTTHHQPSTPAHCLEEENQQQCNNGGAFTIISEVKRRPSRRTRPVILEPMQNEGLQTISTHNPHHLEHNAGQQCKSGASTISEVKRQSRKRCRSSSSSSLSMVLPPMHTTPNLTPHDKQEESRRSSRLRSANNKRK